MTGVFQRVRCTTWAVLFLHASVANEIDLPGIIVTTSSPDRSQFLAHKTSSIRAHVVDSVSVRWNERERVCA